ncbi:MAG TPA: hypothetical protein VF278_12715 [Pirellulales bacterium]
MMKRSWRSLGLLLAGMAFSFLVLRATTPSARRATSVAHKSVPAVDIAEMPLPAKSRPPAPGDERAQAAFAHRAVAMSAVVIVLPILAVEEATAPSADESSSLISARRIGWSGCLAYASGRDHLGGPRVMRQLKPGLPERLLLSAISNLVEQALYATSAGADALCPDASADDRTPSLAIDSARAKSGR